MHKNWYVEIFYKGSQIRTRIQTTTKEGCNWIIQDMMEMKNSGKLSDVYFDRKGNAIFINLEEVVTASIGWTV
jgi:hypothetical protein